MRLSLSFAALLIALLAGGPALGQEGAADNLAISLEKNAEQLSGVLREIDLGRFVEPQKMPLNAFLDKWLKDAVKPRVRDVTYQLFGTDEQLCQGRAGNKAHLQGDDA